MVTDEEEPEFPLGEEFALKISCNKQHDDDDTEREDDHPTGFIVYQDG